MQAKHRPEVLRFYKWRQYRGFDAAMRPYDLRQRCTPERLDSFVERFAIKDLYVSSACWLDFSRVQPLHKRRAGYRNVYLTGDYVLDFDSEDAQKQLEAAGAFIKPYLVIRTHRGFHAWHDISRRVGIVENPKQREEEYGAAFRLLSEFLQDQGVEADYKCSNNTRHVFRVPLSVHRNGTVCEIVSYSPYNIVKNTDVHADAFRRVASEAVQEAAGLCKKQEFFTALPVRASKSPQPVIRSVQTGMEGKTADGARAVSCGHDLPFLAPYFHAKYWSDNSEKGLDDMRAEMRAPKQGTGEKSGVTALIPELLHDQILKEFASDMPPKRHADGHPFPAPYGW